MLHEFQYLAPSSLSELLEFLAKNGSETMVMSGGTDLLVNIRAGLMKPSYVADLKHIEQLHELSFDEKTGLTIGACVTVNELVANPDVQKRYPILFKAGSELATFQLRNRATVAGNVVTASPCGDMSSPLLCLGAKVVITSKDGSREVPFSEFITGVKKTVLAPSEIVERIVVPTDMLDARGEYRKLKRIKGHDLGIIAVALLKKDQKMRIAIGSAAPRPILLPDFPESAKVEEVQEAAHKAISPIDDVRCTKEYRDFMVGVYIKRLMQEVK